MPVSKRSGHDVLPTFWCRMLMKINLYVTMTMSSCGNSLFFFLFPGKTFVAPWTENLTKIDKLFPITVKTTNGNKTAPATLCQWSEVPQHPGLILCLTYNTCAPIVLMLKQDHISVR